MCKPILKVENVKKTIKKRILVDNTSFSVEKGKILALCGGNGAGKSTLLRMIVGILRPTEGLVEVNGLQWKTDRQLIAEQIGYMPDDYQFSSGLTALEHLLFWASLRKVGRERVFEVLHTIGLINVEKQAVASFSKGMRQRLLFGQAILAKPLLLIMDEPTNGLDPFWIYEFKKLVQQTKEQGYTIIFSTHQLAVAEAVADDAILLREGSVVKCASVAALKEQFGINCLEKAFMEWVSVKPLT